MITSLLFQDHNEVPVVLCRANTRHKEKHAVACHAAGAAFLRSLYGHQPPQGLIRGYIYKAETDGAIVVAEIGFHEYGYCTGMFQLPIHVFKNKGQPVCSTMKIADFLHRRVVVKVINRYQFNGIFLSNVAAITLASDDLCVKPKDKSSVVAEA